MTATKPLSRNSSVKKLFCMLIAAMVTSLLSGCYGKGSSAPPPTWLPSTAGDGRIKLEWTGTPGVDYWIFTATEPNINAFNWEGMDNELTYISASTPFYMCGLLNNTTYYFAANGRTNGGPGGESSATINDTPILVPHTSWTTLATPTPATLNGAGYMGLKQCSNISSSAVGSFAVVGDKGAIYTSEATDGYTGISQWNDHSLSGYAYNLYAVTGYAANQNNAANPKLRWVAVGEGGATVISTDNDAAIWATGRAYDANNPALHAVTLVGSTFWAAGDIDTATSEGTILSSTDGITWTKRTSHAPENLLGITHGNSRYVAVGENGAITTSSDGSGWTLRNSQTTENLLQVSSILDTYVAVGDNGTIVTSDNNGVDWTAQTISSSPMFVGVAANFQHSNIDSSGNAFSTSTKGIAVNQQFVAVDINGNYYTSPDGLVWSGPFSTGTTALNTLVSSGFGYVAAGNAGATAYAF
jgi:hypothetical protein